MTRGGWRRAVPLALGLGLLAMVGACTGSSSSSPDTTVAEARHSTVDLSAVRLQPIPEGGGNAQSSANVARVGSEGQLPAMDQSYTEAEYELSGTAATYTGPATGPAVATGTTDPYVTRVLVRQPTDPSQFSGRVFVEPLNTSGGAEIDAVWAQIGPMLEANGDAWIGVTERAGAIAALKTFDPQRYAGLDLPVNDYAWDILRQVGALTKEGGSQSPLHGVTAEHTYMGGFSQSGVEVGTYANAFHDTASMSDGTPVYDGYLPAGHASSLTPLQSGDAALPKFEFAAMAPNPEPVVDLETQSDVEGFKAEINPTTAYTNPGGAQVRRDDSNTTGDKYRLYEIAGAPHAAKIPGCDGDGSTFPTDDFVRGAVARLYAWAEQGIAPTEAPRLELTTQDVVSVSAVDGNGNTVGGVRSPFLDVPLVRYEVHSTPGAICELSGRETPLAADVLAGRYAGVDDYMAQFTPNLDTTIDAGYLRAEDREAILDHTRTKAQALLG